MAGIDEMAAREIAETIEVFLEAVGLHRLAFRLIAILKRRRQLFVLARHADGCAAS